MIERLADVVYALVNSELNNDLEFGYPEACEYLNLTADETREVLALIDADLSIA